MEIKDIGYIAAMLLMALAYLALLFFGPYKWRPGLKWAGAAFLVVGCTLAMFALTPDGFGPTIGK